jgi:hypothetical protein
VTTSSIGDYTIAICNKEITATLSSKTATTLIIRPGQFNLVSNYIANHPLQQYSKPYKPTPIYRFFISPKVAKIGFRINVQGEA